MYEIWSMGSKPYGKFTHVEVKLIAIAIFSYT